MSTSAINGTTPQIKSPYPGQIPTKELTPDDIRNEVKKILADIKLPAEKTLEGSKKDCFTKCVKKPEELKPGFLGSTTA